MPKSYLPVLLFIAGCFSSYSLSCYYLKPSNWKTFLRLIAVLNLLYCAFTLYVVSENTNTFSALGYAYFGVELAIIFPLALVELYVAGQRR